MLVALYTSRVVLNVLGVNDFGIYNLVGGLTAMLSFLNNSMSTATQRFINFEIPSNDIKKIRGIFNISLKNHFWIAIIILILGETIGLWFLNHKLNIPSDRLVAANYVYQFSLFSAFFDIVRIPLGAIIIAFERMSFYAFLGLTEIIFKIVIIIILLNVNTVDHLILFGFLYFMLSISSNILFLTYCTRHFGQYIKYERTYDRSKNKELLSFSGWTVFGQLAGMASIQGLSMILNIFNGVVVNAAIGVANQVNNAVFGFISNFQVAFQPQIVQSYANDELNRTRDLTLNTSRYSFYLMGLLSMPILFFGDNILQLWLGSTVPEHAVQFVKIILICSLIESIGGPFWMAVVAIGNIKKYSVISTIVNFLSLPIAYIMLKLGYSVELVFSVKILIPFTMHIVRYTILQKHLRFESQKFSKYLKQVFFVFSFIICFLILGNNHRVDSFLNLFFQILLIEFIFLTFLYFVGFSKKEKLIGYEYVKRKLSSSGVRKD